MALIICPECGNKVSDRSQQCICCGYPLSDIDFVDDNNTCVINNIKCDLSWLVEEASNYSSEKKIQYKCVLQNIVNKPQEDRLSYVEKLQKNGEESDLNDVYELAKKIRKTTPISFDAAQELLLRFFTDDKIPISFNGETYEEWSKKVMPKKRIPCCPRCGSTAIEVISTGYREGLFSIFYARNPQNYCKNCGHRWRP